MALKIHNGKGSGGAGGSPTPPGGAGPMAQQQVPAWLGRICPVLSAAGMGKHSPIAGPTGQPQVGEAVACQGPACMFFLNSPDADGVVRQNGSCAITVLALSLATSQSLTVEIMKGVQAGAADLKAGAADLKRGADALDDIAGEGTPLEEGAAPPDAGAPSAPELR